MSKIYTLFFGLFFLLSTMPHVLAGCIENPAKSTVIQACEMQSVSKSKIRQDLKWQVKQQHIQQKSQLLENKPLASEPISAPTDDKTYLFASLLLIFACGLHRIVLGAKLSVALQYTLLNFFMGLGALLGLADITAMALKGTTEPYEKNHKLFAVLDAFKNKV
ncbi:MAG: hypothetical protein ACKVTZ_22855 [Bacteroidia bacterium]